MLRIATKLPVDVQVVRSPAVWAVSYTHLDVYKRQLLGRVRRHIGKHMRVTLHHFGSNVADNIVKVEPTGFTLELTVERHLKKHIQMCIRDSPRTTR